jgi:prepilin-type N-terminal cleavage/methylation domain-containing protein
VTACLAGSWVANCTCRQWSCTLLVSPCPRKDCRRRRGARPRLPHALNSQQGLTLVEVIVAMTLAALVSVGVLSLYGLLFRIMFIQDRYVQAQGLAERAILTMMSQPCEAEGRVLEQVIVEGREFTVTREAFAHPAISSGFRLWRFDAFVEWRQYGRPMRVRMRYFDATTFICPRWTDPTRR